MTESDGPPRAALIAALVLAVGAIAVVLAVAVARRAPEQPVGLVAVPAPHAGDPACATLLDALPQHLGDHRRASIAQPAPAGAAAWRSAADTEPVVLRCGVDRPAAFVQGTPILSIDGVQWFEVRVDAWSTWYAVDRPVYVALTMPPGGGPEPIQRLSDVIATTLPAVPITPAPAG